MQRWLGERDSSVSVDLSPTKTLSFGPNVWGHCLRLSTLRLGFHVNRLSTPDQLDSRALVACVLASSVLRSGTALSVASAAKPSTLEAVRYEETHPGFCEALMSTLTCKCLCFSSHLTLCLPRCLETWTPAEPIARLNHACRSVSTAQKHPMAY